MSSTYSLYSGELSTLIVSGWCSTIDCRSEDCLDVDREDYSPLDDKYILSGLEINNTVYLQRSIDEPTLFTFPEAGNVPKPNEVMILHGPDVIHGHEQEVLFLGVVTSVHNKDGLSYHWFFNDTPLCNGPQRCMIKVIEPGSYFCKVVYNEIELLSSTVTVTAYFCDSQLR